MKLFQKIVEENKTIYKFLSIKVIFKKSQAKMNKLWTEPIDEKFRKINYLNDDKLTVSDKKRMIQSRFYNELGYYPNISNPQTLNEKVQWLKLYYDNPLITIGCDKYKVKEYIANF